MPVPHLPDVESVLGDLRRRVYELERASTPTVRRSFELDDFGVAGLPQQRGGAWAFNPDLGIYMPRRSETVRFSSPGQSSFWVAGESGPEPLLLGYIGDIYLVSIAQRVSDPSTDTVGQFLLNGTAFATVHVPGGSAPRVCVPQVVSEATTGNDSDTVSFNLQSFGSASHDMVAKVRYY